MLGNFLLFEPAEAEEVDGVGGFAVDGEVAQYAAHDTGEFEAVAGEAAGEVHAAALRVPVDDEMAVG